MTAQGDRRRPWRRWHLIEPRPRPGPLVSVLDRPDRPSPTGDELRLGRAPVTHDNRVELLVGGHETLPLMLEAIARAERSVHIEVMTFFNDDAGYQIRDALLRRLDETKGKLRVRVLYDYLATTLGDPFFSKGVNPLQLSTFMAPLRGAGAEVIDSSFLGDQDPERLETLSDFIPVDLRESILNFPYEVRRGYKRANAAAIKLFGSPAMQRPITRFLAWAEKKERALAEQMSPHRLISRYMVHDHRKIMVIDGTLAFCGGMNLGQEYLYRHPYDALTPAEREVGQPGNPEPWIKWHDTCCRLRGPVVNALQALFLRHFVRCGGRPPAEGELDACYPPPQRTEGGVKVGLAITVPGRPSELEREALALISSARESVLLRNPYLIRHGFLAALAEAAGRGAAVRLVSADDHNDSVIHLGYLRSWYPYLAEAGVELREHRHHFSHAKALAVDGRRALLGSFNYNNRSSALDFECGLVVDDRTFAAEVERRLYADDVEGGVAEVRRESVRSPQDLAMVASSLATFEIWGTFL